MSIQKSAALMLLVFLVCCGPLLWFGEAQNPANDVLSAAGAVPDIAIIGDSRAHVGISPQELRAEFSRQGIPGLTVQNFAVDGTDASHHWSFAHNALLTGPRRPRVIIWASNPLQFDDSRRNNHLEYLRPSDALPLSLLGAPLELVFDVLTMGFFPPWAHRPSFKALLSDYSERFGIRTLPVQAKILGLNVQREELSRIYSDRGDGWVPFRVLQWKDRFDRGAVAYQREYEALKFSEWHFKIMRRMVEECLQYGIKLVVVEMPLAPWFRKSLAKHPAHIQWQKHVAATMASSGAYFFSHGDLMTDAQDADYGDPAHMPEGMALQYSALLTNALIDAGVLGLAPAQAALMGEL